MRIILYKCVIVFLKKEWYNIYVDKKELQFKLLKKKWRKE